MKIKATIDKQELEIEVDEKELVKAGYVREKKEHKRWRAGHGKEYIFIYGRGLPERGLDYFDGYDDFRYNSGNYYQTVEEAQQFLDRQLALVRVNDRIMELNEGKRGNVHIDYNILDERFRLGDYSSYLNRHRLDPMANIAVGEQIISECEDDLKVIFGV